MLGERGMEGEIHFLFQDVVPAFLDGLESFVHLLQPFSRLVYQEVDGFLHLCLQLRLEALGLLGVLAFPAFPGEFPSFPVQFQLPAVHHLPGLAGEFAGQFLPEGPPVLSPEFLQSFEFLRVFLLESFQELMEFRRHVGRG